MELREGAVIANRFRLVRQLGRGGMGEVWAAQHTSLDIPCAVKFIHAESADKPEVRQRFEREAKASAQLRTPNVVQILDYGIWEKTPYIAMEYLDGEPLSARLKRRGRLDAHETFHVIRGIGKGLGKAHQAGIVHRDLKPENVFLVPDDGSEIVKVLDFGVAKETTALDSNTRTGALLGTPYFMSPEQAQGTKAIDHRADLWSLAVVAFRCLTGELPFKSHALGDLLIKIVTHPIPVPSHVYSGVPEGFDHWWARAADRDPARRFQSAKELVESLGLALNVSMPSTLGSTPMPGMQVPQQVQTMIAEPHELAHAGALPFDNRPANLGSGVHPAPAGGSGAYAAVDPNAHRSAATNDGHGASVAGVATAAPAAGGSNKAALVAVVSAIVVFGGVGAFLAFSGGDDAGAETTDAATEPVEAATTEPADEDVAEPPKGPPAAATEEDTTEGAGGAEPADTAEPADPPPPPGRPPGPRPVAAPPKPKPPAVPTTLGVLTPPQPTPKPPPEPPPEPSSKPSKPDFGF